MQRIICVLLMMSLGIPVILICTAVVIPQQTASAVEPPRTADRSFVFPIPKPAYQTGQGPCVLLDEAHYNFHTAQGTYYPFAELIRRDGYLLRRGTSRVSEELLQSCQIYVIADAQPPPKITDPETFDEREIEILQNWVEQGGSLFIITDHMPDPGAISELAAAFNIEVNNGYVLNGFLQGQEDPLVFSFTGRDRLIRNPILLGRNDEENVKQIATFAGSAFNAASNFQPLLVFGAGRRSWMPREYWKFPPETPQKDVSGWFQGGVVKVGKGKLAFFSEAAMFTAQIFDQGRVKAGMNHSLAKNNAQLLLNVMHWLSDLL